MATTASMATPALKRYFTYRLNTLSRLNDWASQSLYLAGTGLSLPDARCLAAVGSFSALTLKQLAFEANLDKGQASRSAQALVERGLITKRPNSIDGRSVILSPTGQGLACWSRIMPLIDQRNRDLTACLSADEQQLLLDLFDRMLAHQSSARTGSD